MKRHEQALLFLAKAAEDESLVDEVIDSDRVSDEIVGFHCQQAAEKILKAVLSEFSVEFRRTHDIRELMDQLVDVRHPLPRSLADLDALTPYATLFRYPGIPAQPSLDRRKVREKIRRVRRWAERKLGTGEF
jgi:HEPN domain-containing protein